MVGAMLQYAQGNIDRDFLLSTLNQPLGKTCNFLHHKSAPAYGLYLKSVEYNHSGYYPETVYSFFILLFDCFLCHIQEYFTYRTA